MRTLCVEMGRPCIFQAIDFNDALYALRYRQLDAIIVAEQFVADLDAQNLFFSPPFCETQPVFIWGRHTQPIMNLDEFKGRQIGVLAGSYLEFYLQNMLPLNNHIIPYSLLENAAFDLLNQKIDTLFSSRAFFQRRAKSLLLDNGIRYDLPTSTTHLESYEQPARSMVLAIRQGDVLLKKKLLAVMSSKKLDTCFMFLPEKFLESR